MPTLYVTAPPEAAPNLARTLVEERLAACVNRVPCESTYRWDGEVLEDEAEEVLFVKTSAETVAAAEERVADLHPYDVPCVERFEADAVAAPFAEWIEESTGSEDDA
ncbi:divalent-cation tolerance protein CutA [Halorarum halophilum]|uniref:Divalent-cation tolerance protein CutA n=1 Tax=Halorarum halophilum TaxID=2743090 RepID=A0A7D5K0W8_9EURY|nr:divalent-cation tolerance protein CutA [Halobaculum halophilum]QLG27241.1 divalent-cation tolerance protein CutA [Halobaculum halophilum]